MIRLFRVSIPASTVLLIISEFVLLATCYFVASFRALDALNDPWFYFPYENGWAQLLVVVLSIQFSLYFQDLYDDPFPRSRFSTFQEAAVALGFAFLIQAFVGYGKWTALQLPSWTMLYGSALVAVSMPLWRGGFSAFVKKAIPSKRLLFLGMPSAAKDIVRQLQDRPDIGYVTIGYLGQESEEVSIPNLGTLEGDLNEPVRAHKPDLIVIALSAIDSEPFIKTFMEWRSRGIPIRHVGTIYEEVMGRVSLWSLDASQILFSEEYNPRPWMLHVQMLYSFLLGGVGLALSAPLILITAILVKISSQGPILYSQERVGLRGKSFFVYKFRSMYTNAETRTGPVWASKNDPRITPIGRWLRKLRLDELPQFFNVLRGEMALVGPRPERPEFCAVLSEQIPFFHQRHLVKPGITGWAQINYRYADTVEDAAVKLEYDLYYVKRLAPALDAYILFHTAKVMLLLRGAQ